MTGKLTCPHCGKTIECTAEDIEAFASDAEVEAECPYCHKALQVEMPPSPKPHAKKTLARPKYSSISKMGQASVLSRLCEESPTRHGIAQMSDTITDKSVCEAKQPSSREKHDDESSVHNASKDNSYKKKPRVFLYVLLVVIVAIQAVLCHQMVLLCEHMSKMNEHMSAVKFKLGTIAQGSGRIVDHKLINYSLEYEYSMGMEFESAIKAGYEPAGYVCPNGIHGGSFLFIKRSK
jgi:hypothetical protein